MVHVKLVFAKYISNEYVRVSIFLLLKILSFSLYRTVLDKTMDHNFFIM